MESFFYAKLPFLCVRDYNTAVMKIPRILKLSKKKVVILAILVVATFLGFNIFGRKAEIPLQFTQVKRQDIKSTISASDSASLKFKSSGKLAFVNVKVGDQVYMGQILAGLDTQDLEITLQQARNTFVAKDAAAKRVEDDLKDHNDDETFLQKETRTAAQVARDNAFDSVKAAEKNIQDMFIVSPISGTVTQANFISGQIAGDNVIQVVNSSDIYFDSEVDEADIAKLQIGQKAEVILDAYPDKTLNGTLDQIKPQVNTTSTGVTVIAARIKLDDPKIIFVDGLSGQASIITGQSKNVLTLPQESVREDGSVVVSEGETLKPKKVITGITSDIDIEIKEGLSDGEKVLLNPPSSGAFLNQSRNSNPLTRILRSIRINPGGRANGPR